MNMVDVLSPEYQRVLQEKLGVLPRAFSGITEAARRKAEVELNEKDEKMVGESLKNLRQMLTVKDEWLRHLNDDILIRFLRARKFDLSRSLSLLRNVRHYLLSYPEIINSFSLQAVEPLMDDLIAICLPYRSTEGCVIGIGNIKDWDPERVSLIQFLQLLLLCVDTELHNPMSQICGCIGIVDCRGIGWKHVRQCTPGNCVMVFATLQNTIPFRLKQLHFIYNSKLVSIIISMATPFFSEKLKTRIKFHNDMTSLHQYIPPEILPGEYGGHLGPSQDYGFNEHLRKNAAPLRKRYSSSS